MRCLLVEDAALVEFKKGVVLLSLRQGRIQRLDLNDTQGELMAWALGDIYG